MRASSKKGGKKDPKKFGSASAPETATGPVGPTEPIATLPAAVDAQPAPAAPVAEPAELDKGDKGVNVFLRTKDGKREFIRTFTASQHGKGFKELADEFASKVEGRFVEDAE